MWLVTDRERELIARVGPVLLKRFDDLVVEWEGAWRATLPDDAGSVSAPVDLPSITRTAVEEGVDEALRAESRESERLVLEGVPLQDVVGAVLLWEEAILRRLARDAMEDIFSGAGALNRLMHGVVVMTSERYSGVIRTGQDEVRRGLEDADRLKSELISNISHDLKTPLTAIQACAMELLDAQEIPADQRRRFVEMILQNSERLARLITRILDVSRIESRALDLDVRPLELGPFLRRLADGVSPNASVTVDVSEALPEALADRDAVERIFLNLIDNAIKYSSHGVTVDAKAEDGWLEIRVADRGPGVPPERRDGLFTKFYQVDPSPGGRRTGSGLGLAIVRGLAEAMGGAVGYRPNRPTGSVFWVRLPAVPTDEGAGV